MPTATAVLNDDNDQLAKWRDEQHKIASQVLILDDDDDGRDENSTGLEPMPFGSSAVSSTSDEEDATLRFELLPLNLGRDDLYGGVDVSFAPPTRSDDISNASNSEQRQSEGMAVAVYVILRRRCRRCEVQTASNATTCIDRHKGDVSRNNKLHNDIISGNFDLVYSDYIKFQLSVPYVSTYLAFREIDPLEILVKRQLEQYPQFAPRAILVDGNGILHPRQAGIASFLGVRCRIPTIGVGKKLCCVEESWSHDKVDRGIINGLNQASIAIAAASSSESTVLQKTVSTIIMDGKPIKFHPEESTSGTCDNADGGGRKHAPSIADSILKLSPFCNGYVTNLQSSNGKILGAVLVGHGGRSQPRGTSTARPIFVSVGHAISLQQAVRVCAELADVRIPEPVRVADLLGRKLMREME